MTIIRRRKNRVVIFLGAGFPLPWGAPKSGKIKDLVVDELMASPFSFIAELFPESFEDLIAALYSYATYPMNPFHQSLFQIKAPDDSRIEDAISVYLKCINIVMSAIHSYENDCLSQGNEKKNQKLRQLFKHLSSKYRHVSVYTTNYDEMLPRILDWGDGSMSLNNDVFDYSPLVQHQLKHSYSNLHGSIHLTMSLFDGHQYEVGHSTLFSPVSHLHELYGGNPFDVDLFSPIILGHNKTQQILSKHFNYITTCFANDLSDCDTVLCIGSSLSDSHLDAIIRQYTIKRPVNYRIITFEKEVHSSVIERNIASNIIGYGTRYNPDRQEDNLFIREDGRLVYYKRGTDCFLADTDFWEEYL